MLEDLHCGTLVAFTRENCEVSRLFSTRYESKHRREVSGEHIASIFRME
jgi:hypothetical protein